MGAAATLLLASLYTNIPLPLFFQSPFDIVSPVLIAEVLASTAIVSCVAGLVPAVSAMKANISEILRAEY